MIARVQFVRAMLAVLFLVLAAPDVGGARPAKARAR